MRSDRIGRGKGHGIGRGWRRTLLLLVALGWLPGAVLAQGEPDRPPTRVSVPEDLFAVITLRGRPCGKVKSHERRGENDYYVTCETGHRYHVYVNDDQRVVVDEVPGPTPR